MFSSRENRACRWEPNEGTNEDATASMPLSPDLSSFLQHALSCNSTSISESLRAVLLN